MKTDVGDSLKSQLGRAIARSDQEEKNVDGNDSNVELGKMGINLSVFYAFVVSGQAGKQPMRANHALSIASTNTIIQNRKCDYRL